jgi:hypothetical protein
LISTCATHPKPNSRALHLDIADVIGQIVAMALEFDKLPAPLNRFNVFPDIPGLRSIVRDEHTDSKITP